MSETAYNTGQYRELRADVENLKTNFADLRHDIDARFKEQQVESREQHREMLDRFDAQTTENNNSKPTLEKGATVVFGAISLVLTLVWGYSTLTQGAITDKVNFTNDKIAALTAVTKDNFAGTTDAIRNVTASLQKLADTTIPRPELDYRISMNKDAVATLSHKVDENLVPRTEFEKRLDPIREDLNSLKDDTLKRADLDGRFSDTTKRLDLISNRVESLQASNAGTAVLTEQIKEIQDSVRELRQRLLVPLK